MKFDQGIKRQHQAAVEFAVTSPSEILDTTFVFFTSPSEIRAMWSERVANDLKRSIIPFDLTSPLDITASPSEI